MRTALSLLGFAVCIAGAWRLWIALDPRNGRTTDKDIANLVIGAFSFVAGGLAGMWFAFTA